MLSKRTGGRRTKSRQAEGVVTKNKRTRMFQPLRRIAAWSAAVASLAAIATFSAQADPQKVYRKVLPAVMTLEVESQTGHRFVGTAVLTLADDTAVTAWHVVSDARSVRAVFEDGTSVNVSGWVDRNRECDLALIKLEKPLPGRRVALSRDLEPVAARAYVIGAPKGYGFSISDGLVSQVRQLDGFAQYQISCPISPGNSGGPVLNEDGQVIGIVSWTKSDAQNVSFAIPSREMGRLKTGQSVTAWPQPIPVPRFAGVRAATNVPNAEVAVSAAQDVSARGFIDFTRRLSQSAGKKVTVVVQDGGEENKFDFVVPPELK